MRLIDADALKKKADMRGRCLRPLVTAFQMCVTVHDIDDAPTIDAVPMADLKKFAEDVVCQFGYYIQYNGRLHLTAGGLSTLEWAFSILGWEDPKPFPEGECEWDSCHEHATCGTPTPDGYKRVCGKHFATIQAYEEAERNARMDGGG